MKIIINMLYFINQKKVLRSIYQNQNMQQELYRVIRLKVMVEKLYLILALMKVV